MKWIALPGVSLVEGLILVFSACGGGLDAAEDPAQQDSQGESNRAETDAHDRTILEQPGTGISAVDSEKRRRSTLSGGQTNAPAEEGERRIVDEQQTPPQTQTNLTKGKACEAPPRAAGAPPGGPSPGTLALYTHWKAKF